MMKFRQTSILSLVMSDASVACVELHTRAGAVHIHQTGMFDPGAGATLDTPDALGAALAMFLREREFTARHAVVGVPARWLMAMERDVPAVPVEQGEAILRLRMERRGAGDGAELVFDYAGTLSGLREPGRVLLVGMMRRKLEQITRAIDAAGLKLVGVTSTSLALASFEPKAARGQTMLLIGRGSAEVVSVTDGVPRMIRHVSMGASTMTQVGQELRRALVMTSNGSSNGTAPELSTWETGGLSTAQVEALSDALGARLSARSVSVSLGVNAPAALSEFAPAVAVGVVGLTRALPIDLAHSRLVPKVASRFGRRGAWGVACGVVALLALGGLYVDVLQRQSDADAMAAQLTQIAPDLESAQASLARFNTARGYFESRPLMLDGMLALTNTFRDDEPIWITNFALRDTFAGQMQGKANEQRHVLAVLDRMKKSAAFGNVKLIDMRDAGGKTREVAFSISFTYRPG